MKTNQILTVTLDLGEIHVGHKDGFGSLNELFVIGNKYRVLNDKSAIQMADWLRRPDVQDFIAKVTERIGRPAVRAKKGRGGGTWAHLYVLLDAAASLSADLKLEIYERFVEQKLLEWRDRSGDNFIELNAAVALAAEDVFGKPAHKGHFVNLATIIKRRCGVEDWNFADAKQLHERARIEEALTTMLRAGVVRDWDHLKELAEKV